MKGKALVLASFFLCLALTSQFALGIFYPESYIKEKVTTEYYPNKTLISEEREGSVEILTEDVLQDVQVNLSSTSGTNLVSRQAYRPALASPGDVPAKLYLNTTESDKALNYQIDSNETPRIDVKIEYENEDGGIDIHSGENVFNFSVVLESTKNLQEAEFTFTVPVDTGPNGEDSFSLGNQSCTNAIICGKTDSDNDGYYETVRWTGDLNAGEETVISFEGTTQPGENFPEAELKLNLDSGTYKAQASQAETFTGITFVSRLAKDSARNGVYLTEVPTEWVVRGFFKNKANHLRYKIGGWALYRVGNETPLLSSTNKTYLDPGETVYTEKFYTEEMEKEYFLSSFDWEVVWGDSYYTGEVNSYVQMPKLYVITSWLDKSLTLEKNDQSGRRIRVKDVVRHLGHEKVKVKEGEIYSLVPHVSENGTTTKWSIQNVSLFYRNSTSTYDITSEANITAKDATSDSDGYVMAELNTTDAPLDYIEQNEDLILKYEVTSSRKENDETYVFGGNSTLWTRSGTPDLQTVEEVKEVPGVKKVEVVEKEAVAAPPAPRLELEPVETTSWVVTGNVVKVVRSDRVIDTGDKGARRVTPQIFLPEGGELRTPSLQISYQEKGEWKKLGSKNFSVVDMGIEKVGNKSYHFYDVEIPKDEVGGLTLYDNDLINVSYRATVKFGKNEIITRLSGYNYYEDRLFSSDAITPVRVGWEIQALRIWRGSWKQMQAIVGEPVKWKREIKVENPNNVPLGRTLRISLPEDAFSCQVANKTLEVKEEAGRKYVEWRLKAEALEERIYTLEAYTSPVILTQEEVKILGSKEVWVKFLLRHGFRNFAPHSYKEVYEILPIRKEKIWSVTMDGKDLAYSAHGNETKVSLGSFRPYQTKSIDIVYKEFPPILIVTPDAYNYTRRKSANISVLVVGKKEQATGFVELTVEGPMPGRKTVYADIMSLHGNRTAQLTRTLDLGDLPPGNYSVRTYFRVNFENILSEETNFWVSKRKMAFDIEDWHVAMILIIVLISLLPRIYRKKETYKERLKKLRKKVKKF